LQNARYSGGTVLMWPDDKRRSNMNRHFKRAFAALGIACVLASGTVLAKGGHHRHAHDGMAGFGPSRVLHLIHRLGLEGAQRDQVFAIADRYKPELRQLAFSLHDGRTALRGILQEGTYDAARVERDAVAQAQSVQALYQAKAKMLSEISAVLAPEQRAQLAATRDPHHTPRGN
jgi:Spy/CpxP family protein refolding chaperone